MIITLGIIAATGMAAAFDAGRLIDRQVSVRRLAGAQSSPSARAT
jgi:hypothetical protein